MIYQTSQGINPEIKSYGCYFLSILYLFAKKARIALSIADTNQIYSLSRKVGYVGKDAYILQGGVGGIAQIASAVTPGSVYMRLTNKGVYGEVIGKWSRELPNGKMNSHFVVMKNDNKVEYDPWSAAGSKTVREGSLISRRYIVVESV